MPMCNTCRLEDGVNIEWEQRTRICPLCSARKRAKKAEERVAQLKGEVAAHLDEIKALKAKKDKFGSRLREAIFEKARETDPLESMGGLFDAYTKRRKKDQSERLDGLAEEAAKILAKKQGISIDEARAKILKQFKG